MVLDVEIKSTLHVSLRIGCELTEMSWVWYCDKASKTRWRGTPKTVKIPLSQLRFVWRPRGIL